MNKLKCVIIGCGYWGSKIFNYLKTKDDIDIVGICDINEKKIDFIKNQYKCFTDYNEIIKIESDIVFIATRPDSHGYLSKLALNNNKHVFVEKPMALNIKEAEEIILLANEKNKLLCVDHTFLFSPEINIFKLTMNMLIEDIKYMESIRCNWGPHNKDTDVIWDLAPHDFSISNFIIPFEPIAISAVGVSAINNGIIEKCNITVYYKDTDFKFFINVSLLEMEKSRKITITGKKYKEWNDSAKDNILNIHNYEKNIYNSTLIKNINSLDIEIDYFINCIKKNNNDNIINGENGLKVIKMLEAASKSVKSNGAIIFI